MITGILIIFPLILALIIFSLPSVKWIKILALGGALAEFIISLWGAYLYVTQCRCNLLLNLGWMEQFGVTLRFGMDGISLLMVLLTTFLIPLILLSSFQHDYKKPSAFYGLILLMEAAFIGVFTTFDGLVFYIFWELALIPAYFITAVWGGKDRIRITFKFFIYTFTGSLFMLVAMIFLYFKTPAPHSFSIFSLYNASLTSQSEVWVFLAFLLAFAIKIPIFPFHTWQPDTYTEAPAGGTMLLSGIMLKMGLYGLLRFVIPICPHALMDWGLAAIILSVTGIVYASIIAIRQNDLKRLVAYSSIAHVGLISAGIFSLNSKALEGAVIQMVSHGINIVGLFIMISIIERRVKTRDISSLGGIATVAPWFASFFMIILLGSIALPLTNGFIGEFLILLGIFDYNHWIAAIAGSTVIFSAVYMLWMYQRTMFGNINREWISGESNSSMNFKDLNLTELLTLIPIVIMIFWIGLFPGFFLHIAEPAVMDILNLIKP
jgi:NADH-quinone oxidoreductase subunit M